ncbi:hypothetical protein RRG08_038300 [Elysia crispata]|uniref:Uncharacterized protein n=1 Tax=Elysia crispata TaxID=231223 RepID=A0AAE1AN27_9GAST|nr:hypothetical protein RRG08_038300 [Elysia crispata]
MTYSKWDNQARKDNTVGQPVSNPLPPPQHHSHTPSQPSSTQDFCNNTASVLVLQGKDVLAMRCRTLVGSKASMFAVLSFYVRHSRDHLLGFELTLTT